MCYHTLYLFLACGHSIPSITPLAHARSPPCPARSRALFHNPSLTSPILASPWYASVQAGVGAARDDQSSSDDAHGDDILVCNQKLSHPLHTYRIAGLCRRCERECEERLARFEVGSIKDGVEREGQAGRVADVAEDEETAKAKVASLGLRSGYVERRGRGRGSGLGMLLRRNGKGFGEVIERTGEENGPGDLEGRDAVKVAAVAEAMGWGPRDGCI
jgi:hypothetical protein